MLPIFIIKVLVLKIIDELTTTTTTLCNPLIDGAGSEWIGFELKSQCVCISLSYFINEIAHDYIGNNGIAIYFTMEIIIITMWIDLDKYLYDTGIRLVLAKG